MVTVGRRDRDDLDPASVIVYHQTESFDILRAIPRAGELSTVTKEAGVVSESEVTFHSGGWGKLY